jgi:hypothetical protein
MLRLRSTVLIAAGVAVVAAASVVATVVASGSGGSTKLAKDGDVIDYCWASTEQGDWTRIASEGQTYGLDLLALSPAKGEVTVTDAKLVNPEGGLRLVAAVFSPSAKVGGGLIGRRFDLPSYLRPYLRPLPAQLRPVARPAGAPEPWNPADWQLSIVVSAPASATNASANGVDLTYRSGSSTHTYRTVDNVRLLRATNAQCDVQIS